MKKILTTLVFASSAAFGMNSDNIGDSNWDSLHQKRMSSLGSQQDRKK